MKKYVNFLLALLVVVFVVSCDRNDTVMETPLNTVSSVEQSKNGALETRSFSPYRPFHQRIIEKWNVEKLGNSTILFKHKKFKSLPVYLIFANVKAGAKVGMLFDSPNQLGTEGATFSKRSISAWNEYGSFFALTNSYYFGNGDRTPLPFPLKQDGKFYTKGNGGANVDRRHMKCALNIYDDYVEVVEVGTSSIDYSKMRAPRSYVGFSHAHGNREGVKLGRTFAGVLDMDYDGIYESIVILVVDGGSKAGLIHDEAKNILINDVGCISSNIVTFDGSGSSQLIVPSISRAPLVKGDGRIFPVCFVVKDR